MGLTSRNCPTLRKEISGSRIDFKGPDHLKAFYHAMQRDMQFLAYFETPPGRPFLFVSETSKPIATLVKHDRENILFLPSLRKPGGGYSDYPKQCERFMAAFQELNEHLAPKKPTIELPAWSSHYGWETERLLRNGLVSLQSHADEIATQINRKTAELELQDRLKVLFTGKGDVLVEIVIDVFSELGATADPGEPGRDDVVLEFEGKHAVIECADF